MEFNVDALVGALLCFLPVALVLAVIFHKRAELRESSCAPFDELRRRPAGESLRLQLELLDEKINDNTLWLVLFPCLMAVGLYCQHSSNWIVSASFFLISAGAAALFGQKLFRLLKIRSDFRLGYEGERFVGEELSRLISFGFEIYHDVPFDGFNVVHVLVGPRGVFIVETKTRRKPLNQAGRKEFRVQFDGRSLQWWWGADNHGIEQAKSNAKTLAAWLGSATGETMWVTPILTLPGWLVDRKVPSDNLHVLNPKEIDKVCAAQPEKLTEPQMRRICHQLDQKCRIAVAH